MSTSLKEEVSVSFKEEVTSSLREIDTSSTPMIPLWIPTGTPQEEVSISLGVSPSRTRSLTPLREASISLRG